MLFFWHFLSLFLISIMYIFSCNLLTKFSLLFIFSVFNFGLNDYVAANEEPEFINAQFNDYASDELIPPGESDEEFPAIGGKDGEAPPLVADDEVEAKVVKAGRLAKMQSSNGNVTKEGRGFLTRKFMESTDRKVVMYLYTQHNRRKGLLLNKGYKTKGFDEIFQPNETTKFIVHGWSGVSHGGPKILLIIKNAYLQHKRPGNFIFVDWSDYSQNAIYSISATSTTKASDAISKFAAKLVKKGKIESPGLFHCIGFSLGGQICGQSGYKFHNKTSKKFGRISGLDPAGPSFSESEPEENRLEKSDADFVDVMHCNTQRLGTDLQIGHVDFYPNGGYTQPGLCAADPTGGCSHSKCPKIYKESIKKEIKAYPCENWEKFDKGECSDEKDAILAGDKTPLTAKGKYYFKIDI